MEGFEWISLKRKKFCDKNIFSDNAKWSSKRLWKMISADVKTNVKQLKIKELGSCILLLFYNYKLISTIETWHTM